MVQVSRLGSGFTVLVDGVAGSTYATRGEAVAAAIKLKEML
jgi:hypothetical protein